MKKKILIGLTAGILAMGTAGMAATIQINVTGQNDSYYHHEWWSGGYYNHTYTDTDSIPTSYYYYQGSGGAYDKMKLTFDLSSLATINVNDITGATLNLNITSAYNNGGGSDAGKILYNSTTAYVSVNDNGWTSFDILTPLITSLTAGGTSAVFKGENMHVYDGCGYSFTSAEEGHPAYLEITSGGSGGAPVPEPATMLLFGTGLAGLAGWRKKRNK